ncbi:MAG: hypothetical protein ACI94Y_003527 [Maribacter sp.]|jgi:hypothetical protein
MGNEGMALKSTTDWSNNSIGTDIYGFNGLPNGYVSAFGEATGAQLFVLGQCLMLTL